MARASAVVLLSGSGLSLESVEAVARGARCRVDPSAIRRCRRSRAVVERALDSGRPVYGVNTGFGHLAEVRIPDERLAELQQRLIRSHAAGVGDPLPLPTVRAMLALRVHCLARGHSGIRPEVLEFLVACLNADVLPVVPRKGSVGASGDLAPLAHAALLVLGEGDAFHAGRRMRASTALRRAGLSPIRLEPKEGLALLNGTQMMAAVGSLALLRAERLARSADVAGAMSLEALRGSHRPFDARIHRARPHPGQRRSAANLRRLLADSAIERSHRDCGRVQDAYSLRCMPQIHGAVRDALAYVRRVLEVEINASTDNPMVFAEQGDLVSCGNFHGQPVALAMDHLAAAVAALAAVSERRIERLVNPDLSGLPPFLAGRPGLDSGFMIAQVSAAALVSENKMLAHPASVDSIPTSAGKEDHVSMGAHGALRAETVVANAEQVVGIEVLVAAQALDLLAPLRGGRGVEAARRAFRRRVPRMKHDRILAPDLDIAREFVVTGSLLAAAEHAAGPLP